MPDVGVAVAAAVGGWLVVPDVGITKSVTLWAGTDTLMLPAVTLALEGPVSAPEASCQPWAVDWAEKFAMLIVTLVVPESAFEITITVSAPSKERWAANDESVSEESTPPAVAVSLTLVSPNVDLFP